MVAFLFQQKKAPCHFSLLATPILLQVFSILLQKGRQYCLWVTTTSFTSVGCSEKNMGSAQHSIGKRWKSRRYRNK